VPLGKCSHGLGNAVRRPIAAGTEGTALAFVPGLAASAAPRSRVFLGSASGADGRGRLACGFVTSAPAQLGDAGADRAGASDGALQLIARLTGRRSRLGAGWPVAVSRLRRTNGLAPDERRHCAREVSELRGGLDAAPWLCVAEGWAVTPRAAVNSEEAPPRSPEPGPEPAARLDPDPFTVRGKRDRAVLELLYGTASRVGECERLDLPDVDLLRGQLFVRLGKGRKDRVVPVVGRAAAALDVCLRDSRPEAVHDPRERALFLTTRGTRLPVKRIEDLVRSHAKAAGITVRVTPYTLRHGCATHLLQNGADVRHVQKLLGHACVNTTAIYTHVAPEDLRRAVEKAHPRERRWRRRR
jgi:site-specific recombinase XerC